MRKFFLPPERKRLRGRSTLKAKKKAARLYSLRSSTKKALPLYASFQVPLFSLAILLRDRPDLISGPVALVSCAPDSDTSTPSTTAKPVILAVNHEAARYRVTEGLSPTKALARCPHLNLISSRPDPALFSEILYADDIILFATSVAAATRYLQVLQLVAATYVCR